MWVNMMRTTGGSRHVHVEANGPDSSSMPNFSSFPTTQGPSCTASSEAMAAKHTWVLPTQSHKFL